MKSPNEELLRVVVTRRGKLRVAEFRLRESEVGLSLFRQTEMVSPDAIVGAVRAAGKQGELAVAEISLAVLRDLRLRLVETAGGTPDPAVNSVHVEARLSRWLRFRLWLRRRSAADYFNEHCAPEIATAARVLE